MSNSLAEFAPDVLEEARVDAKKTLSNSLSFQQASTDNQVEMYKDLVRANAMRIMDDRNQNISTELRRRRGSQTADRASDLIDENRHKHDIGRGVEAFDDLVDTVDFPSFVKDLVKGVFDANMAVMKEQTDNYIKLMKEATKSVAEFVKNIDNTAAFGRLASDSGDDFSMDFDDEGNALLTDKQGEPVDMGDNQVKARIMDAKIALAREHKKSLMSIIAMGITRIVVEDGKIEAGVIFDFKSKTSSEFKDKAKNRFAKSSGNSFKSNLGIVGTIFGGPSHGHSNSTKSNSISVSSAASKTSDELKAKLTGKVDLNFKTDYFELNKFTDLYQMDTDVQLAAEETKKIEAGKK